MKVKPWGALNRNTIQSFVLHLQLNSNNNNKMSINIPKQKRFQKYLFQINASMMYSKLVSKEATHTHKAFHRKSNRSLSYIFWLVLFETMVVLLLSFDFCIKQQAHHELSLERCREKEMLKKVVL